MAIIDSLYAWIDRTRFGPLTVYDILTALQIMFCIYVISPILPSSWLGRLLCMVPSLLLTAYAWRALSPFLTDTPPPTGEQATSLFTDTVSLVPNVSTLTAPPEASRATTAPEVIEQQQRTLELLKQPLLHGPDSPPPNTSALNDGDSSQSNIVASEPDISRSENTNKDNNENSAALPTSLSSHTSQPVGPSPRSSDHSNNTTTSHKRHPYPKVKEQTINPFINTTWWIDTHERIRLSIAVGFLLPFRAALMFACFVCAFTVATIATWGLTTEEMRTVPLSPLRRLLLTPIQWLCRIALLSMGYVYIDTQGKMEYAPIVVANHVGFVEPLYLTSRYMASPIGAAETLAIPIVSKLASAMQAIPVWRRDTISKKTVIQSIQQRLDYNAQHQHDRYHFTNPSTQWSPVLIFPEGTTTNGSALITFKPGAFLSHQAVQPIAVQFRHRSRIQPSWVSCGPSPLLCLIRLLCEPFNHMKVIFLPVTKPLNDKEINEPILYATRVRSLIARSLQIPSTEHSYDDALLAERAWLHKKSMATQGRTSTTTIELQQIREIFKIDTSTALLHLNKFIQNDSRKIGRLLYNDFLHILGQNDTPELKEFFEEVDEDESGEIDFREYLCGLGMIALSASEGASSGSSGGIVMDESMIGFRILDDDGDGRVLRIAFEKLVDKCLNMSEVERTQLKSSLHADLLTMNEWNELCSRLPLWRQVIKQTLFSPRQIPPPTPIIMARRMSRSSSPAGGNSPSRNATFTSSPSSRTASPLARASPYSPSLNGVHENNNNNNNDKNNNNIITQRTNRAKITSN